MGVFGRFGYANSALNAIGNFWSIGLQYQGLFEGRDDDVLGIGFAQGILNPSIQYISNTGNDENIKDVALFGLRAQMTF